MRIPETQKAEEIGARNSLKAEDAAIPGVPSPISRRQFLLRNAALFGTVALGEGVLAEGNPQVTWHRLRLPHLKETVRLVQLSDFHRSWCVSEQFLQRIVAQTNALKPDIALLTGDFVTHSSGYMGSCLKALNGLKPRIASYAVLGNHDYACDAFGGVGHVIDALSGSGVEVLTNRSIRLDCRLRIVGIDDCWYGRPDAESAFRLARPDEAMVAMTHNPAIFPTLSRYDCVTLCGHTHGGQINLPFLTRRFLRRRVHYLKGWFRDPYGPGRLYVSRGVGVVGIPIRLRCDPEIAVFDLEPS